MGSGYTDTTTHKLTREPERGAQERGKKEREEGGRLHLEWNLIRVRRKGGGWREKGSDNGERSRMVQTETRKTRILSMIKYYIIVLSVIVQTYS